MPRHYSTHTNTRKTPRTEAEKEAHRREVEKAGGWYLYLRQQREERERQQETRQASEGRITADAPKKS